MQYSYAGCAIAVNNSDELSAVFSSPNYDNC